MRKWMLAAVAVLGLSVASLVIAQPPGVYPGPGPIFNNTNTTNNCMANSAQFCAWATRYCHPTGLCSQQMRECIDRALCFCQGINCEFSCEPNCIGN